MPRTRVISRVPFLSRMVVMMAGTLLAVSALIGLPEASAPSYATVAMVSDISPGTPVIAKKCKKRCNRHYSDADLKQLTNGDVESVAALGTVLAVIALAAVL